MNPTKIKLKTSQKIVPLLKAINTAIPWQFIVAVLFSIVIAYVAFVSMPAVIVKVFFFDFIIKLFIALACAGLAWAAFAVIYVVVDDKIIPLIEAIRKNYEDESLKVKKEILDNVIDEEILLKK